MIYVIEFRQNLMQCFVFQKVAFELDRIEHRTVKLSFFTIPLNLDTYFRKTWSC